MKVIAVSGSLRFKEQIMHETERMELQGNCMLSVIYPTSSDKDAYTDEEVAMLGAMHRKRIELADALFVVNVGGYIGEGTRSEIEYAKKLNKEIIYLEKEN